MIKYLSILVTLCMSPTLMYAQASGYVENKGQWADEVEAHYAYGTAGMWLLKDRVRFSVLNREQSAKAVEAWHDMTPHNGVVNGFVYDMVFGSTAHTSIDLLGKKKAHLNYFLGNNRERWKSEVGQYQKSVVHEVKTGIDVAWEIQNGHPKYTLLVGKRADLSDVYIDYHGVRSLEVKSGRLEIGLGKFAVQEMEPIAYQLYNDRRVPVDCSFRVEGTRLFFDLGAYNEKYMLYVDPVIVASTHSGSTAEAFGHSATFDGPGNIYSAGRVFGVGYPTDTGSFDLDYNGPFSGQYQNLYDVCISKYNPDGSELLYATYLGGSLRELPHSLIVNNQNQLLVLGSVLSSDFPSTMNAYDTSHNGGQDIYVAKFSSDGSQLLGSTFLGGSSDDGVNTIIENYADDFRGEIVTDDSGSVYIASFTQSNNFPHTSGVLQNALGGGQDGIIAKFDASLSQLLFGTFLGGNNDDAAFGLKVGQQSKVYVTGTTKSTNFPVDAFGNGAMPNFIGGNSDAYIIALNSDASQIIYSTFYGTTHRDHGFFLELDGAESIYILGWSNDSINSTSGKYQGPSLGSYITKFSNELDTIEWECGFGRFSPAAFLVDMCSHIYASGQSALNPTVNPLNTNGFDTLNTFQQLTSAGFYVMALSPEASDLEHAFFYGTNNSHVDGGTSRFDKRGYVYQDVCNCSGDFPTVPWAYADTNAVSVPLPSNSLECDNCAFKVDFEVPIVAAYAEADIYEGCGPLEVNFSNQGSVGTTHLWKFGDGSTSIDSTPVHTFDTAGVYKVIYTISDTFSCNVADSAILYITVNTDLPIEIGVDTAECLDSVKMYLISNGGSAVLWSTGDTGDTSYANISGNYWLIVEGPLCGLDSDTVTVSWTEPPQIDLPPDTGVCELGFSISGPPSALDYSWNTGDTSQMITVDTTGLYVLTISDGQCQSTDSLQVYVSYVSFSTKDTSFCEGSIELEVNNVEGQTEWSTGENSSTITVSEAGTYWVTVSNGFCISSDTIRIDTTPVLIDLGPDTIICGPIELDAYLPELESYTWSNGDTTTATSIDTTDTFWVTVTKEGCSDTDSISVTKEVIGYQQNLLPACDIDTVQVAAPGPTGLEYQWSTGDTSDTAVVTEDGWYFVTITSTHCTHHDSIKVVFGTAPTFSLGDDVKICRGDQATLQIDSTSGPVLWNTGDTTSSVVVHQEGQYIASMKLRHCIGYDSIDVSFDPIIPDSFYLVPNVITPNGDELNEELFLYIKDPTLVVNYRLSVYNRWGVIMFETEEINVPWDATNRKGNTVEEGTYFYLLEAETICTDIPFIEVKDNVTVLR